MDFFCGQILSGKIPVETLYDSYRVLAFRPPQPMWQEHIIVVSKKHIDSLTAAARADEKILVELLGIVARLAREVEDQWGGCHISTETGDQQIIPHLHFVIRAGEATPAQ